jgi:hypothetical protein
MEKKTLFVLFVLFAFIFGGCGFNFNIDIEQGSGNVVTETRQVSNFERLSLSGLGDVVLTQGNEESLQIEAEDNVIANIKSEVRNGTLYITYERKSLLPTKPIKFFLAMREVRGLETLGVSNLRSDQIKTDRLNITISGTGSINILNLEADQVTTNISGAGNFEAEGQVRDQKVTLSGAGNYDGEDLLSKSGDVTITGLGRVSIWATDQLDVTISGTGDVYYFGSPNINKSISGIGNLNHQGNK